MCELFFFLSTPPTFFGMCCCTKKEKPFGQLILYSKFLEKDFLQRRVRYKNQIFHSKRHHKRQKLYSPKEGKEKQRRNKRTGREIWLVRRSSALFVVRRYLKRSIGFEEKTLNPSLLKDLEFKRRNERSFKSIIVKRLERAYKYQGFRE